MDLGDQQQVREETIKTVALCTVFILCFSIPAAICVNQYLLHRPTQKDGLAALQFNIVCAESLYVDVLKRASPGLEEAQSIGLLNSCVVERTQTGSFPFWRLFYVAWSFLFLGVTLQLNLVQVSMLVSGVVMLCNFVFLFAIAGAP